MNITTNSMKFYIGGQVEIIGNDYRYRGQISKIEVIDQPPQAGLPGQAADLHVEFEYICLFHEGQGYKPDENKPYVLALGISGVSDIGYGRICVNSSVVGEMSIFYPPKHNKRVLPDGTMHVDD